MPASSIHSASGYVTAGDPDARAVNTNLYDIPTFYFAPVIGLERLDRCAPSLPPWLMAGLVGKHFSLFGGGDVLLRSSRSLPCDVMREQVIFRGARGVSIEETERLQKEIEAKKGHKIEIPFIPLGRFFTEPPPQGKSRALWESEAALFVRWGLF